jgi:regulator of protease activity HflC (stomatin/prohibitin superfamily)
MENVKKDFTYEEIVLNPLNGVHIFILNTLGIILGLAALVYGIILFDHDALAIGVTLIIIGGLYATIVGPIMYKGLRMVKPNEAVVLALFGKYMGSIKKEGFYFVNPFAMAVNPATGTSTQTLAQDSISATVEGLGISFISKKISLKVSTFSNNQQKINDQLGNPIEIGIVVIWKVANTAKAVFNVDNYKEFLSIQCDSALRNIVRMYPYDAYGDNSEKSLRGSSNEISEKLKQAIQEKVEVGGLEIVEAQITHLAYAPEIASATLQRQQASAIIDAKQMIVENAVDMVEMAVKKLSKQEIVNLDEERKAAMVSNLLVVLCGDRAAQPVVNSGSIY